MSVVSIVTCPGLSASSIAVRSVRFHQSGTFFRLACPAHGDTGLSLAIRDLPEGGIGARCFTHGCSYHEIAQTLGLPKPESESHQCPVEACRSCPARTPHHLTTVAAPLSMERCGFQPPRARSRFRQFRVEWSLMTGYDNHKRAGGDGNRNSRHRGGMRNG